MLTVTIDYAWLDTYGIDLDVFLAALAAQNISTEPNENGEWIFDAVDADTNGIPDFLDALITDPFATNVSQGTAIEP